MRQATDRPALPPSALALLVAAGLCLAAPARGADWIDAEGGAMRVVLAPPGPDGGLRGILEVTLEPGWKTYWRDPGDGGIAPALSVAGSGSPIDLQFPVPERISDGGMNFLGYHAGVAFPFVLGADAGSPVTLSAFIGVCREICVPFAAEFTVSPEARHGARIERAFAALPAPADAATGLASARIADGVLHLEAAMPADGIFLAPERGMVAGPAEAAPSGFTAPVLRDDGGEARLFYTLLRAGGAVSGWIDIRRAP